MSPVTDSERTLEAQYLQRLIKTGQHLEEDLSTFCQRFDHHVDGGYLAKDMIRSFCKQLDLMLATLEGKERHEHVHNH